MLYADKRNLEVNLQVALLRIRDKELIFYADNLQAIGTQAALLSGFAYNAIIMVAFPPDANKFLKACFLVTTTASMSLELMTVGGSMISAIQGPGLALRGPDGSMHRAVDGMLIEYKVAFMLFATGLVMFVLAAFFFAIIQFSWIISLPMAGGMVYFGIDMWRYFNHIYERFSLTETVTGRFDCGDYSASAQATREVLAEDKRKAAAAAPTPRPQSARAAAGASTHGCVSAAGAPAAPATGGGAAAAALAAAHARLGGSPRGTPRRMY